MVPFSIGKAGCASGWRLVLAVSVWLGLVNCNAAEPRGLYGIHDSEPDPSEYLNHIESVAGAGWVTATVAVGHNPADPGGADFSSLADQGHTVICRINNGYFPNGTIPLTNEYDNFAARCSNFVAHSSGCHIWVIGNELNLAGEWPFNGTRFQYVSPQDYARCFRKVYNAIKAARPGDEVLSQPPAPFAGPFGASTLNGYPADGNPLNWAQYLHQTLSAITNTGPLDGIALHTTSRGYSYANIHDASQVTAGGQRLYFSFNVYRDWVEYGIPKSLYHLPLYATECNGYYYWKGGHPENPAAHYLAGWMQEIYAEIDRYNQYAIAAGKPLYRCVNMYRWCGGCDGWNIDGADNPYKAQILSDLDTAVARNYTVPQVTDLRLTLISTGAVWRYLDNGSDQGTVWRQTNFNDSAWAMGSAQLGYGDGDEATVVNGGPSTNHFITTYFRRSFLVPDGTLFTNLTVRLLRDDGGVVYLNGTEIFRSNLPTNQPIYFYTRALSAVTGGDESTNYYSNPVNPGLLRTGANVLAVEIHQSETNSSDISFDLELKGLGNMPALVRLGTPLDRMTIATPTNLALSAVASDPDGVVSKVEFFIGAAKLGEDFAAPYSAVWSNAPEGLYTLTAVATDNGGKRATSAPVQITLLPGLVRARSVWKYLDTGVDPGPAWRTTNFNDRAWLSGPAQLGYGDGDEATVVSFGPNDQNKYITTWFRRSFEVTNPALFTNLLLRVLRDDGAVVYLNGAEVFRSNLPTNTTITATNLASSSVPAEDESTNFHAIVISANYLVPGTNFLAVEVHQVSVTSSDLSFDLELFGLGPLPGPALRLQRGGSNALLSWPAYVAGYQLQSASALGLGSLWADATNGVVTTNLHNSVTLPLQNGPTFYRLRKTE